MIIKLNGANFSDKNIGTLDLPVEIDSFTKSVLQGFGYDDSVSENKAFALQKFINSLKTGSSDDVWSRIDHLFIPCAAKDVAHCMYDVITGQTITLNTDSFSYDGKYVRQNEKKHIVIDNAYIVDFTNTSVVSYSAPVYESHNYTLSFSQVPSNSSKWKNISIKNHNDQQEYCTVTYENSHQNAPTFNVMGTSFNEEGVRIVSFKDETIAIRCVGKYISKGNDMGVQYRELSEGSLRLFSDTYAGSPLNFCSGFAAFMIGKGLTEAEMGIVDSALTELVGVFS